MTNNAVFVVSNFVIKNTAVSITLVIYIDINFLIFKRKLFLINRKSLKRKKILDSERLLYIILIDLLNLRNYFKNQEFFYTLSTPKFKLTKKSAK
jgi:hypothetical protein